MMRLRAGAVVAVTVALLLSGCTQVPSSAHTAAAAVAPAPTPTPAGTYPTCASMVPQATIDSIDPKLVLTKPTNYMVAPPSNGTPPNDRAVFMSPVYPPSATALLAAIQAGYFDCYWTADGQTLSVAALPDASASYESFTAGDTYDIATFDGLALGDRSIGGCKHGDGDLCEIQTLVGATWVSAHLSQTDVSASTAPGLRADLESVIRSTIATLRAAGTLVSAQAAPPSRWQTIHDCAEIQTSIQRVDPAYTVVTDPYVGTTLDLTDANDEVLRFAVRQSGAMSCASLHEADVTVLPGADVTAPVVYTAASTAPVPVAITGVVSARDLCVAGADQPCWTEGYIDHALVTVWNAASAVQRHAILAAIAAGTADS